MSGVIKREKQRKHSRRLLTKTARWMEREKAASEPAAGRPALMPTDTPDHMTQAWVDCLHWAFTNKDVRAAFEASGGTKWEPPRSALDVRIDKATGADKAMFEEFVAWFNENVWGTMP